jgi:hypothetical protein
MSTGLPEWCAGTLRRPSLLWESRRHRRDLVPLPVPPMIQPPLALSSGGGAGCCVASGSDSDPCAVSVGGHRMQPASCSNSQEDLSSNVPESNICVTTMMTHLCSNIQFRPSSTIWDGAPEGFCPPLSMLPRPNHAAVVSLSFLPLDT